MKRVKRGVREIGGEGVMRWTVFFLLFCIPGLAVAGQDNWVRVSDRIERALYEALKSYSAGRIEEAMEKVADAYFGIFEGEKANMEIAVRRFISLKKATELEKRFGDIRKAMHSKTPLPDVKRETTDLIEALNDAARELDRKGVGLNQ